MFFLCVSSCVGLCMFFSHVHLYLRFMDSSFLRTSHARLHCRVRLRIVCSCTRVLVILCTCHLAVPNFDRLCTYAQVRFCTVNNRKPFSQTTILGITKKQPCDSAWRKLLWISKRFPYRYLFQPKVGRTCAVESSNCSLWASVWCSFSHTPTSF